MFQFQNVVYLEPYQVKANYEHYKRGVLTLFRNIPTTWHDGKRREKNVKLLNPESEEDFFNIMESCARQGIIGPTSFASIFHRKFHTPSFTYSVRAPFTESNIIGGWQEAIIKGEVKGPIYHYDIVSAYRSVMEQGLPSPSTVKFTDSMIQENGLYLVRVAQKTFPWVHGKEAWVTGKVLEKFQHSELDLIGGYVFSLKSYKSLWQKIERCFPHCHKRIGRSFWGRWIQREGIIQCSKNGITKRKNYQFAPLWGVYIIEKIREKLLEAHQGAGGIHVFVDSIMVLDELPSEFVGSKNGQFMLKRIFKKLHIFGAGQFVENDKIIKWCGLPHREREG